MLYIGASGIFFIFNYIGRKIGTKIITAFLINQLNNIDIMNFTTEKRVLTAYHRQKTPLIYKGY